MKSFKKYFLFLCLLALISNEALAQGLPQGITYQGIARNSSGIVMTNQPIGVRLSIYSSSVNGTLQWQESHSITTNQLGLFYLVIGQGISTGNGNTASFDGINWGAGPHFIQVSIDQNGGSSFVDVDTMQFWSVPYAFYSQKASSLSQPIRINDLVDADTLGVNSGYVLKWNGTLWVPAPDNDSDTAMYSMNSFHSQTSDTADYLLNSADTVLFAYHSDTAGYSNNSNSSVTAVNSNYCDTATYALNTASSFSYWNLNGNPGTNPASNFIGTTNSQDFIVKTNNLERIRITSAGRIGIGTTAPTATMHLVGNDGLIAEGTFGVGAVPPTGAGTRMFWYPKKAAFRAGSVFSNQWDDIKIGNYSFAANYSTTASGNYSTSFGKSCVSSGENSLTSGDASIASGFSSVALGSVCYSTGAYSISLGRGAEASDSSAVAIGYTLTASGKHSLAFGGYTNASGDYSVAMGFHASTNGKKGSFVFADMSSTAATNSTIDNQFVVRASGGYALFSNTSLTMGVSLAAGGGSWTSVSDKSKKENFRKENAQEILNKLSDLDISSWNYKTQHSSIRHIGPMAQDFYTAFRLGESDSTITGVDIDGISLLAIQALAQKTKELKEKSVEVEALKQKLNKLEKDKKAIEKRVVEMEHKVFKSTTDIKE